MVRACRNVTLRLLLSFLQGLVRIPITPVVLGFMLEIAPVAVDVVRDLAVIVSVPVLFVEPFDGICFLDGFVGSASEDGSVGKPLASCGRSPMAEKSTSTSLNRPVTPSQKPY